MNATFTTALRYLVIATCVSPLRTGGTDHDLQKILRYADGTPFLQGASLAGAMNAWKPDAALFGDQEHSSSLIVSDLVFSGLEATVRPRLAINPVTGACMDHAKFDLAALPAGTVGVFYLTWTGDVEPDIAAAQIESYLQAINCGSITLGAQKSNGYGRVALRVQKRTYELTNSDDRKAWLQAEDISDWETVCLSESQNEDVVFYVTAKVDNLLVKESTGEGVGESGIQACQMRQGGQPIIPGSSIKGTLRGHINRMLPNFQWVDVATVESFLGRSASGNDNGIAGKARFSDGVIANSKSVTVSRNRINRITGGTIEGALFSEESVAGDLSFDICASKDYPAGLGLLLFALRDLGLGLCELGSGSNVGRGRLYNLQVEICCAAHSASLLCADGTVSVTDPDGLIASWNVALKEEANETDCFIPK